MMDVETVELEERSRNSRPTAEPEEEETSHSLEQANAANQETMDVNSGREGETRSDAVTPLTPREYLAKLDTAGRKELLKESLAILGPAGGRELLRDICGEGSRYDSKTGEKEGGDQRGSQTRGWVA